MDHSTADYAGAYLLRCKMCNSVYLIGITERHSAITNICPLFENDYKCPGRLVALDERIENLTSFRALIDHLESMMEEDE